MNYFKMLFQIFAGLNFSDVTIFLLSLFDIVVNQMSLLRKQQSGLKIFKLLHSLVVLLLVCQI